MSFTTGDLDKRFKDAARRGADRIGTRMPLERLGADPYDAVAYGGPGKAASLGYAARVAAVIAGEPRLTRLWVQGRAVTTFPWAAQPWLNSNEYSWIHCFSNQMPDPVPYRVYVCTALAHTHDVLRQLLQGYLNMPLYFKVATHSEAQRRNDTIVSWHQSLAHARVWANIARANHGSLEGEAPAGTFGGIDTNAVGIDTEVAGDTSTSRISRAALALSKKRSPYI